MGIYLEEDWLSVMVSNILQPDVQLNIFLSVSQDRLENTYAPLLFLLVHSSYVFKFLLCELC